MFWSELLGGEAQDRAGKVGRVAVERVSLQEGEVGHSAVLQYNGAGQVGLQLSLVQLPGYGDSIDNTECWQPVRLFVGS